MRTPLRYVPGLDLAEAATIAQGAIQRLLAKQSFQDAQRKAKEQEREMAAQSARIQALLARLKP